MNDALNTTTIRLTFGLVIICTVFVIAAIFHRYDPTASYVHPANQGSSSRPLSADERRYMDQGFDGDIPAAMHTNPALWSGCTINSARTVLSCPAQGYTARANPGRVLIPAYVK